MKTTTDAKFFIGIARNLIRVGDHPELAQRYLDVMRRRQVVRNGIKEAHSLATKDNVLTHIHFHPPLSVAGCSVGAVAKSYMLQARGVPIATERDERGRHRGTSAGEVIERVFSETGRALSDLDVVNLYQAFMSAHPALLSKHPIRRFRVLPGLRDRLMLERAEIENRLTQAVIQRDDRIFSVAVDADELFALLYRCSYNCDDSVVLGYAGTGSKLRINGTEVTTLWGVGKGLGCVATTDLQALAVRPGQLVVGIEFDLHGWNGYADTEQLIARKSKVKRFGYYGEQE